MCRFFSLIYVCFNLYFQLQETNIKLKATLISLAKTEKQFALLSVSIKQLQENNLINSTKLLELNPSSNNSILNIVLQKDLNYYLSIFFIACVGLLLLYLCGYYFWGASTNTTLLKTFTIAHSKIMAIFGALSLNSPSGNSQEIVNFVEYTDSTSGYIFRLVYKGL